MRAKYLFPLALMCVVATADEGLWLVNGFPKRLIQERYGFQITPDFMERLQRASVRFNNGGSGSFVSSEGLLFTNHHVGADCIHKLSTSEDDYMAKGFYAPTAEEERACPDLEVNLLLKIEDVTSQVNAEVKPETPPAETNRLRKASMSSLEKACTDQTGNRCDVVTLYSGGRFHLYQYKKYTDIRLVFAPESSIAAFGGDPDNFTYPRYCLDFALFRAYENGKPVQPQYYFPWSKEGARDGELVFVSGHPGNTGRLATMAQLEFYRDTSYPVVLERLGSLVKVMLDFGAKSAENKRVAEDDLLSFQNSFKAYTGFLRGLRDPKLMALKREEERQLRAAVDRDPEKAKQFGKLWEELAAAYKDYAGFYLPYALLEGSAVLGSELFDIARDCLRLPEERQKPNEERLREYRDSALASLEQQLYSPAPITGSLETTLLAEYFRSLSKYLGADNQVVKKVLAGRSPEDAARHYVSTSKLKDVAERKRLAQNLQAVRDSQDGMIQLARLVDEPARKYRKMYEDRVESAVTTSAAKIAQVRFAVRGTEDYPDATFTLRVSFAGIKGYKNDAGQSVPWATRFKGLYERATGVEPFNLPPTWLEAKNRLDLNVPFNFVSTADTHGGNSGSPTVNTKGEVVGILFDGNLEGLPNRFVFTDEQARSVHVASQGIVESLRSVYRARRILKELGFPE